MKKPLSCGRKALLQIVMSVRTCTHAGNGVLLLLQAIIARITIHLISIKVARGGSAKMFVEASQILRQANHENIRICKTTRYNCAVNSAHCNYDGPIADRKI
jgi:hypothetical protein